jgi:Asp-tRNA(Asn)/Glu-tRNA(Gln) amidotransferase A subunit family amidase
MTPHADLHPLDAWEAAQRLARREITAEALLRSCLARIAEREPQVQAFAALDAEAALAQARAIDAGWGGPETSGSALLRGLPLGAKDIFDTADLPTACGSPIHAGQRPRADAAAVALCRAAGAVLVGKTVTSELANMTAGPTRNPHRLTHTPGGSSSGSAAAVADGMLMLALGTQTAGSLIRPAAFCGVVAYKPSVGRVPRAGVKSVSESMDVVGGFARSVRGAALLGAVLTGDARLLPSAWPADGASEEAGGRSAGAATLRIGLAPTPDWPQAGPDTQRAWDEALRRLGPRARCEDAALPPAFARLAALQQAVMAHEAARALAWEHRQQRDRLSEPLRALLDQGAAIPGERHAAHQAEASACAAEVDALFANHDVLLAPSTLGEAPAGLAHTGDPLFCRAWSLLGLPSLHLPFTQGASGLPVGLQLVGRHGEDHRLFAAADRVHAWLRGEA